MKIKVFKGTDGQWYFTLVADNGEPLATSEGHKNHADVSQVLNRYFPTWQTETESFSA